MGRKKEGRELGREVGKQGREEDVGQGDGAWRFYLSLSTAAFTPCTQVRRAEGTQKVGHRMYQRLGIKEKIAASQDTEAC